MTRLSIIGRIFFSLSRTTGPMYGSAKADATLNALYQAQRKVQQVNHTKETQLNYYLKRLLFNCDVILFVLVLRLLLCDKQAF